MDIIDPNKKSCCFQTNETEQQTFSEHILKQDGKIRLAGVSTENFDYIKHFNREGGLDVVQLDDTSIIRFLEVVHLVALSYCFISLIVNAINELVH